MKYFVRQPCLILTLAIIAVSLSSAFAFDEDFDHLFEEYNNFRETQQTASDSDGEGLTLTHDNQETAQSRDLNDGKSSPTSFNALFFASQRV